MSPPFPPLRGVRHSRWVWVLRSSVWCVVLGRLPCHRELAGGRAPRPRLGRGGRWASGACQSRLRPGPPAPAPASIVPLRAHVCTIFWSEAPSCVRHSLVFAVQQACALSGVALCPGRAAGRRPPTRAAPRRSEGDKFCYFAPGDTSVSIRPRRSVLVRFVYGAATFPTPEP